MVHETEIAFLFVIIEIIKKNYGSEIHIQPYISYYSPQIMAIEKY